MERYSGLVIESGKNRTYRTLRAKRNYEANNPTHATMQLEPEIPARAKVVLTVGMNRQHLGDEAYEELTDKVLKLFDEAGVAEIDPYRLTMTAAIVRVGKQRRTYLLAVAPVSN